MAAAPKTDDVCSRLAVIENKIQTLIDEVSKVREYVPEKMVEYGQRITVLERNTRTIFWVGGIFAAAIIGAFVAHILK
jgi:hypothetical protein